MTDFTKVQQALERRGYTVRTFAAAAEAAAYLDGAIDGKTVGFGGSATLDALGVYDKLAAHNTVIWHWKQEADAAPKNAQRLGVKTPCAVKADRCYDCRSPERVCRALVTLWGPMLGMETEVLLVDEDLGL